jgi:hypothetical protein
MCAANIYLLKLPDCHSVLRCKAFDPVDCRVRIATALLQAGSLVTTDPMSCCQPLTAIRWQQQFFINEQASANKY